ncbi:MAG: OmpH family outer membrane protein, partial [Acidobacteriales bacterium]|nr:OmpH family outer membrane protein [Terriglobales bacterium]
MIGKLATTILSVVLVFSVAAAAQANGPAPTTTPPAASAPAAGPMKIAVIDIQTAIIATNEGQRDFNALNTKFDPKRNELQNANKEIEDLRKQLQAQDGKLNEDARGALVKSIEQKQKVLQRNSEDAQNDYQQQQNEIVQRILTKLAPVVRKYATDNGLALLIDTSNPWPQGPVLWVRESVDITKPVVEAYNAQSGVPAPPKPATGGAARPATTPAKPAAPSTTAP